MLHLFFKNEVGAALLVEFSVVVIVAAVNAVP